MEFDTEENCQKFSGIANSDSKLSAIAVAKRIWFSSDDKIPSDPKSLKLQLRLNVENEKPNGWFVLIDYLRKNYAVADKINENIAKRIF